MMSYRGVSPGRTARRSNQSISTQLSLHSVHGFTARRTGDFKERPQQVSATTERD